MGRRLRQPASWRFSRAWVTVAPAVLTLVLGAAFLGRASMWLDEAITWFASSYPVAQLVRNSAHVDAMFLPYYLFMHVWLGVSHAMWWMRLPSLLAGAAAVQALVLLARRWLPLGWSVLAGILLALNPLFAEYTIQARPYTITALFAVLSTAALVSAIDRGGRRRWALYSLASLCLLLSHLLGGFVLAAHFAGVAIARRRSALAPVVAAIACACAAVSPLVVMNAREAPETSWVAPSTLKTFHWVLGDLSGGHAGKFVLLICGIIVAASLAFVPRGSDGALGPALCLAWGAGTPLFLVLAGFVLPLYQSRYALAALPGIALIEAMAGRRLSAFLAPGPMVRQRRAFMLSALIYGAVFAGVLALLNTTVNHMRYRFWGNNFRAAAAELSRDLSVRPAPVDITSDGAGVGFSYYVTPPEFAHEIYRNQIKRYNFMGYWAGSQFDPGTGESLAQSTSVVDWPAGARPVNSTRCAAGWAIGLAEGPPKTLRVGRSICQVRHVNHYGNAWIASLS